MLALTGARGRNGQGDEESALDEAYDTPTSDKGDSETSYDMVENESGEEWAEELDTMERSGGVASETKGGEVSGVAVGQQVPAAVRGAAMLAWQIKTLRAVTGELRWWVRAWHARMMLEKEEHTRGKYCQERQAWAMRVLKRTALRWSWGEVAVVVRAW